MRLTLYSNCRLTKEYNEVIQNTYLNDYLNSLTKIVYEDIGEVYLTRQGTFNVSMLSSGIFQYNYFKLEDEVNSITRYFFIDEINIVNGTCVIDYSEDIWSSYSSYINIVKGNVSNLRYGLGSNLKLLPVEYASNDNFTKEILDYETNNVTAIVTLSFYNFEQSGEPSYRFYKTFVCDVVLPPNRRHRIKTHLDILKGIISGSSGLDGFNWTYAENVNFPFDAYDVVNAYIVPEMILTDTGIRDALPSYYSELPCYVDSINIANKTNVRLYEIPENHYSKTYDESVSYTTHGIGLLDNFITITPNGTKVKYGIDAYVNEMFINFTLQVETSIIDLTSSFNIDLPISVQSADVTQQQAISKSVQNQVNAIDRQMLETHKNSMLMKWGISSAKNVTDVIVSQGMDTSAIFRTATEGVNLYESAENYKANVKKNELDKWQVNYEMFKTNTIVSVTNDKLLSLYYGLIILKVVPDNENYVNAIIDIVGYNTNIVVTDNTLLTTAQESKTYNIIKFSSVMMYGNIPHSIQADLSAILTKGVKIYFTSSI